VETCSTCRHFFAEGSACRRYPPTVIVIPQMTAKGPTVAPMTLSPAVNPDAVCGEHRGAEER